MNITFHPGFRIVGIAALSLLSTIAGIWCFPWGINDPHSSAGFFTLGLYFFITAISKAMTMQFGRYEDEEEEFSLIRELMGALNKLIAMTVILVNSVPHPQFTGILLWGGIALWFFYSGVVSMLHACYVIWEEIVYHRESRADVKRRIQAEIEITKAMQAAEAQIAEKSATENALLDDLTGFLDNPRSGPDLKGDAG